MKRGIIFIVAVTLLGMVASAAEASGRRADGLTQEQADRGCVPDGRVIRCPPGPDAPKLNRPRTYRYSAIFNRKWGLAVPGAAYQTEDRINDRRVLTVSPGTGLLGQLVVSPNGTYAWKDGGRVIRGRWVATDPITIVLQRGHNGKDWSAQLDDNGLTLWTGASLAEQFHGRQIN